MWNGPLERRMNHRVRPTILGIAIVASCRLLSGDQDQPARVVVHRDKVIRNSQTPRPCKSWSILRCGVALPCTTMHSRRCTIWSQTMCGLPYPKLGVGELEPPQD